MNLFRRLVVFCFFAFTALIITPQAYADTWVGTCVCDKGSEVKQCRKQGWELPGETQEVISNYCKSETYGWGKIVRWRKIPEITAELTCSGGVGGIVTDPPFEIQGGSARACVTVPYGARATALHCFIYDNNKNDPCGFSLNLDRCPWAKSRQMSVAPMPDGAKRYCWQFDSQDVGRKRQFKLAADWVGDPAPATRKSKKKSN